MAIGVERVGQYDIRKLSNGMYSVSLNNGNIGAYMTDEAGVQKIRDKYASQLERSPQADLINFSGPQEVQKEDQKSNKGWLFAAGAAILAAGAYILTKGKVKPNVVKDAAKCVTEAAKAEPKVAEAGAKTVKEVTPTVEKAVTEAAKAEPKVAEAGAKTVKEVAPTVEKAVTEAAKAEPKVAEAGAKTVKEVAPTVEKAVTEAAKAETKVAEAEAKVVEEVTPTVEKVTTDVVKAEPKVEPKPEAKVEPKTESKIEPKQEVKVEKSAAPAVFEGSDVSMHHSLSGQNTFYRNAYGAATSNKSLTKAAEANMNAQLPEIYKVDKEFANLPPLEKDCVVWRGRSEHPIIKSLNKDFEIIDNAKVGDTIVPDAAYSYAGFDKKLASNWSSSCESRNMMYKIHLPKGAKVSRNLEHGGEVVMPRNAEYRVLSKTVNGDHIEVELEYILPKKDNVAEIEELMKKFNINPS